MAAVAAAIAVSASLLTRISAQAPAARAAYTPPKTELGQPNLQGIWRAWNLANHDLEDHSARPGVPAGRGFVVDPPDGKIPYQPWALEKRRENLQGTYTVDPVKNTDPFAKCYYPGIPRFTYIGFPFQIVQTQDYVAFYYEWMHHRRFAPLNVKTPLPDPEETQNWLGIPRARWEGNTLVVDVTNFNGQAWFDGAGNFATSGLKVTERYSLVDANTLQYEATMTDPKVFTRPWTIRMTLQRQTDLPLLDYECPAMLDELGIPHTWERAFEVN
jgi:hypothetical protein